VADALQTLKAFKKAMNTKVAQPRWRETDDYFTKLLVRPDNALDAALRASEAEGLPAIAVSPPQGKLLMLLARLQRATRVLEIGTLGGYSTIWLARGLRDGGKVISLEADPHHAEVARANLTRAGVADRVEIVVGRAQETLPRLAGTPPFDFIFIDADKTGYVEYLEWAVKLGRSGTLIIADNVVRDGEVVNAASTDDNVQGVRRFNDALAARTDLDATGIQTVGAKGYDGFAIAVVS
jgi:predicted O-methyltransferase YrrM